MAGEDDIDWSGFDYKPPPAPVIPAAQQLAEVIDEAIVQAASSIDYDVRFEVPSPFECKDALKHLGCKWNSQRKVWVAKDAAMHKQANDAVALHYKRQGKRPLPRRCATFNPPPVGVVTVVPAGIPVGTVVALDRDEAIVQFGAQPSSTASAPITDSTQDEVAKLGVFQTLAELLCDLDDDPFANLEEL